MNSIDTGLYRSPDLETESLFYRSKEIEREIQQIFQIFDGEEEEEQDYSTIRSANLKGFPEGQNHYSCAANENCSSKPSEQNVEPELPRRGDSFNYLTDRLKSNKTYHRHRNILTNNGASFSTPDLRSCSADLKRKFDVRKRDFLQRWNTAENLRNKLDTVLPYCDDDSSDFSIVEYAEEYYCRSTSRSEKTTKAPNSVVDTSTMSNKVEQTCEASDLARSHQNQDVCRRWDDVCMSQSSSKRAADIVTTKWSNSPNVSTNRWSPETNHDRQEVYYSPDQTKVRQKGDTLVTSQHRDPYSFYWQLDQMNYSDPHRTNGYHADEHVYSTGENELDEYVSLKNDRFLSSDQMPAFPRTGRKVKKLTQLFEASTTDEQVSPKPKFLPPEPTYKDDPKRFCHYWHVDEAAQESKQAEELDESPPLPPPPIKFYVTKVSSTPAKSPHAAPPANVLHIDTELPSPADRHQKKSYVSRLDKGVTASSSVRPLPQPVVVEKGFKQTTVKRSVETSRESDDEIDNLKLPVRFGVRSLGSVEIEDQNLTQEKSSRVVNKAIADLSAGNSYNKMGEGKELIMEIDDRFLRVIDSDTSNILNNQSIAQIRVWGIGKDNGRDFAYVSRDRDTHRYVCRVFRCDTPARTIAQTLRSICKLLLREQSLNSVAHSGASHDINSPVDEPKRVVRCHFLGITQVSKATGIDILNDAVDRLVSQVRFERWILCDVSVTPSQVLINEVGGGQIAECRVRHLSFLGIGRDIKHCAFIIQGASNDFMCYVFHVEPNAALLAKTIETACKIRYQKALEGSTVTSASHVRNWGSAIRDAFGSLTHRRTARNDHEKRHSR